MKLRAILLITIVSITFSSCDSSIFINVKFGDELSGQDYSLIDYNFALANSGSIESLFFEFIVNQELEPNTQVYFYDKSGGLISINMIGDANDIPEELSVERSYVYSTSLEGFRSKSLIYETIIGD